MAKYLDDNGLLYLWGKIKTLFVSKVAGKDLSTNDLSNTLKSNYDTAYSHSQSAHAPAGAEANVQSDWNVVDTGDDAFIKNKPTIPPGVTVDSAPSDTSENPVQNKVVKTALDGKSASSHTHTKANITDFPTSMTPTAHKTSHATGGGDALTPADIGAQPKTDGLTAFTDIADTDYFPAYDASATSHKKTLWSNIKSVLKTYFDTVYAALSHTHTKANITDFPTSMAPTAHASSHAAGQADPISPADIGAIASSTKGQANGVASLGSDGLVPSAQLPSYVDDVVEWLTMAATAPAS